MTYMIKPMDDNIINTESIEAALLGNLILLSKNEANGNNNIENKHEKTSGSKISLAMITM